MRPGTYLVLALLSISTLLSLAPIASPASCSTSIYLTIYNNMSRNASVGLDNVSLTALLSKFLYSNASQSCVVAGIPNQTIEFYLTSNQNTSYYSKYYGVLYPIGAAVTGPNGRAALSYNSSLLGFGNWIALSTWNGNATTASAHSNLVNISLSRAIAAMNGTCSGPGCGNATIGNVFTLTSFLCISRPPFSWSGCMPLARQKVLFNASVFYMASRLTNSSGGVSLTYNTYVIGVGSYDLYSTWNGGKKYAYANATSLSADIDLNILPSNVLPSNVVNTTTTSATTTTVSEGLPTTMVQGSTASSAAFAPRYSTSTVVLVVIIMVIGVSAAWKLGYLKGRRHAHHRIHERRP